MSHQYRTLMRVQSVKETSTGASVNVEVPAVGDDCQISIPNTVLPDGMLSMILASPTTDECTVYLHAKTNLMTLAVDDLPDFSAPWSLVKVRHHGVTYDTKGSIVDYGVEKLLTHAWEA